MTGRKMNPNSLENLRLGAIARNQNKVRCHLSISPESKAWLGATGDRSRRLDELISKVLKGELVGSRKVEELELRVKGLEAEVARLRSM